MATLDILSAAEAYAAVNVPGTAPAATLARIAAMSTGIAGQVDKLCGPVVRRAVTETHSGGGPTLVLRRPPVDSITTVTETTGTTPATLTTDDFLLEASGVHAVLHRRASGYGRDWVTGLFNISVAYSAGRYAATANVEEYWKNGVRSILAQQWQREASQWSRNPAGDEFIPEGAFDLAAAVAAVFNGDLLAPGVA